MEQPVTHEEKWSSLGKIISEYDQEIPQSQTAAGLVMANCDSILGTNFSDTQGRFI